MNLELVASHITPDFVIDVGANCGGFYQEAKAIWPDAHYFLIEGNSECEPVLQLFHIDYAMNLLSDREQTVTFYTRKGAPTCTGASYYREQTEFYEGDKAIPNEVRTTTLDKVVCPDAMKYDCKAVLLKLDCQGSELDIMRGGPKVLAAAKGVIVEVAHVEYNRGAPTDGEVANFMLQNGFNLIRDIEKITHPLKPELHIQSSLFYMRI